MDAFAENRLPAELPDSHHRRRAVLDLLLLTLAVGGLYGTRLTTLPIRGEEPRRAQVATEMLETGDWVVPRLQGHVYCSRPPLANWLIAAIGAWHGRVDTLAVRLPSVLAIWLLVMTLYLYARGHLGPLGAFVAGLAYATMAQVLELGRLGETESVFALMVAGSLMTWHAGYLRAWSPSLTWSLGYTFAALAGLTKGLQGPVYFILPVTVFLGVERRWSWLFCRGHLVGLALFAGVLLAWQVPFLLATDWCYAHEIWCGNALQRFDDRAALMIKHLVSYPLELLICMLPWSLPLLYLANRPFWRSLGELRRWASFHLLAVAVTFPTVWLAGTAHSRYFMPLYPCCALLVGLVVQRCVALGGEAGPRQAWNRFLLAMAIACGLAGCSVPLLHWLPWRECAQSGWLAALLLAWSLLVAGGLLVARHSSAPWVTRASLLGMAAMFALVSAGVVTNIRLSMSDDTAAQMARVKSRLPAGVRLVSLGVVHHVFAYYYGSRLPSEPWPNPGDRLPPDVIYFCFNQVTADPVNLPFAYEKIDEVPVDRYRSAQPARTVVIARRLEDAAAPRPLETAARRVEEHNEISLISR